MRRIVNMLPSSESWLILHFTHRATVVRWATPVEIRPTFLRCNEFPMHEMKYEPDSTLLWAASVTLRHSVQPETAQEKTQFCSNATAMLDEIRPKVHM